MNRAARVRIGGLIQGLARLLLLGSPMAGKAGAAATRGYTLVELLVVVVIAGVLVTLGVYGVRKYIFAAKTSEALEMIGAIKTAQEAYRDETHAYLNVSQPFSNYYPRTEINDRKVMWGNTSHTDHNRWLELGVNPDGPVVFRYSTSSGGPTDALPATGLATDPNFPSPPGEPWYLVKAVGDLNGDGTHSVFIGSSFTNEIFSHNEGE